MTLHAAAIVLAAGAARRFGGDKLHYAIAEHSILAWTLAAVRAADLTKIFVVRAPDDHQAGHLVQAQACTDVVNPNPQRGLGSSIACGARLVAPDIAAVYICLADMPAITAEIFAQLANALRGAPKKTIARPYYRGIPGHPVVFRRRHLAALCQLDTASGARELLDSYRDEVFHLPHNNPGVVTDLDSTADIETVRHLVQQMRY